MDLPVMWSAGRPYNTVGHRSENRSRRRISSHRCRVQRGRLHQIGRYWGVVVGALAASITERDAKATQAVLARAIVENLCRVAPLIQPTLQIDRPNGEARGIVQLIRVGGESGFHGITCRIDRGSHVSRHRPPRAMAE
jgi:hypothetical protein